MTRYITTRISGDQAPVPRLRRKHAHDVAKQMTLCSRKQRAENAGFGPLTIATALRHHDTQPGFLRVASQEHLDFEEVDGGTRMQSPSIW